MDEEPWKEDLLIVRTLFEGAYKRYWDLVMETGPSGSGPVSYALVDAVEKARRLGIGQQMVSWELRELINCINSWGGHVWRWEGWMRVLRDYPNEQDAWQLRREFIEPIAHHCMLRPSAMRDLLARVATNAIHQTNLTIGHTAKDELDEDRVKGFLGRRRTENQLARVGSPWRGSRRLEQAISSLDSEQYRENTRDYRNLSSHAIAPHFEWGEVNCVTRYLADHEELVLQADGHYRADVGHARRRVCYGFGGTPALDLSTMLEINKEELQKAYEAWEAYRLLIEELLTALGQ